MLNLDTHILVYALQGEVTAKERKLLSTQPWSISAIVLWELAKLTSLGRLRFDLSDPEITFALEQVHVWPLTLAICKASTELDIKSDPADEIIAATSIVHRVPLITRDKKILASDAIPFA